jgi:hypothetical protein
VALRVEPRAHIEEDARAAFLCSAFVAELKPQLRFADAAGSDHDRQRSGDEAAAQERIESGDTGR